jgi:hypothetical protein
MGGDWTCELRFLIGMVLDNGGFVLPEQDRLVEEGYNPSYGARPLRRAIMRLLEDSMAERMLSGDIKEGDSVIIDVDADGQVTLLTRLPIVWCFRSRFESLERATLSSLTSTLTAR